MSRSILAAFLVLFLCGCGWLVPTVRTAADIVRCLCELVATEQLQASPDALDGLDAEEWCEKEENRRPFAEEVAAAKQAASQRAGFGRGD